jgi:hypothetical protein
MEVNLPFESLLISRQSVLVAVRVLQLCGQFRLLPVETVCPVAELVDFLGAELLHPAR